MTRGTGIGRIYSRIMLDATRLRVLVAVARHGSVTAAAHALNYAQPSISHHIARLEAETGAKLMERAGRGVRLTEAGRLLAERATEILGRLDAAEAELAAHLGLRQDRVRLAAPGLAVATLVAAAAALQTERPATELMVTQAEPTVAVRMLRDSEADIALTSRWLYLDDADSGRLGHDDDLHQQLLVDEPLFLVSRSSESGSGAKPLCLAEYARHRWIAYGGQAEEFLLRLCRADGHFVPHIAVRTGDYVAAQALVAAGLGVAVLPGLARRAPGLPGVEWAELDGGRHQLFAVTYPAAQPTPAVSWLVEALMRAAREPR
jgi:DNA-binding transcriptional LysR family regulator